MTGDSTEEWFEAGIAPYRACYTAHRPIWHPLREHFSVAGRARLKHEALGLNSEGPSIATYLSYTSSTEVR